MSTISFFIKHPRTAILQLLKSKGGWIPDKIYLRLLFRLEMGYWPNFRTPKTFSEKLQWLKLYDRRHEYTIMVDKCAVKDYVAKIIGKEFIVPTIGIWERVEDIDWDSLPNRFVMKCNHDSGGLIICKDKTKLDKKEAEEKLNRCLKTNFYKVGREWPYKNVPRRIIAEEYIEPDPNTNDLPDYKFFCFNGVPKYCQVISGRNSEMCVDFFDENWIHQPFHEPKCFPFSTHKLEKPTKYELMWNLARDLSKDKAFSRIDFYQVRDKVYFGEITFYPTTGMGGFDPEEYDYLFGKMINLSC